MIKIVGVRFKNAGKIYYFDPVELEVEKDMEVGEKVVVHYALKVNN